MSWLQIVFLDALKKNGLVCCCVLLAGGPVIELVIRHSRGDTLLVCIVDDWIGSRGITSVRQDPPAYYAALEQLYNQAI